ncbi:MAG TPA: lysophospholipid acyltransferase family protein [Tepidisphaeraceae bacterium]|jgi:1-acyl-sn-glycerol-3-phosphate acyltransferase
MEPWKLEPAHDHGMPLEQRLKSVRRESGLIGVAAHVAWWRAIRIYLRTVHRLKVEGLERLPTEPPFVLVANHQSHLDALILASQLPWRIRLRTYPIAAADTFFDSNTSAAFAAATINALPMQRGRGGAHALDDLRNRLAAERCVYVLFPEGTRSRDGSMNPFKPGIGMFLAGTDAPAVPCHIQGAFQAMPPNRRVPRATPISLRIGDPINFKQSPNNREGWTSIARQLEIAVRDLAGQLSNSTSSG